MARLTQQALEFARTHIRNFYDSDFFPKPIEFDALWNNWGEVVDYLVGNEINSIPVLTPRTFAVPKPNGTFRVVHQLDPINSLVYTAMSFMVADELEAARFPEDQGVACSYRISTSFQQGEFFADSTGYPQFISRCTELSGQHDFVLTVDIADFYNQIYVHRVENALSQFGANSSMLSKDFEVFLMALNGAASKGIPVGPAASILMAEAIMVDVDQFLASQGVAHTRYVDDIRIFHDSKAALNGLLERLTLYLYTIHRLSVSSSKTGIIESDIFLLEHLNSPDAVERQHLHEILENAFTDYSGYGEESFIHSDDLIDNVEIRPVLMADLFQDILGRNQLDLGLARHMLRKCKKSRVRAIATEVIENLDYFAPVIRDVVLYLDKVSNKRFIEEHKARFAELLIHSESAQLPFVRFWLGRYFAENPLFLQDRTIHQYVFSGGNICNQCLAAQKTNNVSWVRNMRGNVDNLGPWERRSLIAASQILARQERQSWLSSLEQNAQTKLDRWVIRWARSLS